MHMFSSKPKEKSMSKGPEFDPNAINLIGAGTLINGDIQCEGDVRIDGTLVGNLQSKGKLVVGTTGSIKGEISCKNADLSGTIQGKIQCGELVSLKSTCRIQGNIRTSRLAIEPGALFTGTCDMGSSSSHVNEEKPREKPV